MGRATLAVALDRLPAPSYSQTIDTLGCWEKVVFTIGQSSLSQTSINVVDQGGCRHLDSVAYSLRINVAYRIGRELRDRAEQARDTLMRAKHRQILTMVRAHAAAHHTRIRDRVLSAWRERAEHSFEQAAPSHREPTSADAAGIESSLETLVRYWVAELAHAMAEDAYQWDTADYPRLEQRLRHIVGHRMRIPRPRRPSAMQQGLPQLVFPTCRRP